MIKPRRNLTSLSLGSDGSNITAPWRMRKGQRLLSGGETRELIGFSKQVDRIRAAA